MWRIRKKTWNFLPTREVLKRKAIYVKRNIVVRWHTLYASSATMTPWCHNIFLSFVLKWYLNSRDKTNNCTCVRCIYHVIYHQIFFNRSREHDQGNWQECWQSKQSVKMHKWISRYDKECLKFSTQSLHISFSTAKIR